MREQITKIEPQPVITRDNVTMEVDAVILSSSIPSTRPTGGNRWGLEQMTLSAPERDWSTDLDHCCRRATAPTQLRAALDSATQRWGVKVIRIGSEHQPAGRNPPDDGKADDGRADARHAGRRRGREVRDPQGRGEAGAHQRGRIEQAAILAAEGRPRRGCAWHRPRRRRFRLAEAIGGAGNPAQ